MPFEEDNNPQKETEKQDQTDTFKKASTVKTIEGTAKSSAIGKATDMTSAMKGPAIGRTNDMRSTTKGPTLAGSAPMGRAATTMSAISSVVSSASGAALLGTVGGPVGTLAGALTGASVGFLLATKKLRSK